MDLEKGVIYHSREHLFLMQQRYRNAAHFVDRQIGRVVSALKEAGVYDQTAIVATSDHGEAFGKGVWGHSRLNETVRRVPIIMRLPDVRPQAVEHIFSHQDIYPTLFDYLGIKGIADGMLMGTSVFPPKTGVGVALTVEGNVKIADLTLPDHIVRFMVKKSFQQITFMPLRVTDRDSRPIEDSPQLFAQIIEQARPYLRRTIPTY